MSEVKPLGLSYQFLRPEILEEALRHKSYVNEQGRQHLKQNEKLEFLGDAVLDLVLSEYLMEKFPGDDEGSLSKKRASLVNESVLAQIAGQLNLQDHILLGKGELLSDGKNKPRLLALAYEAILGAVFQDGGYQSVQRVVREQFDRILEQMDPSQNFFDDFKTRLQELSQATLRSAPSYEVKGEEGPSHSPQFEVNLMLQGKVAGTGRGRSKKMAEQEAARMVLQEWERLLEDGTLRKYNG